MPKSRQEPEDGTQSAYRVLQHVIARSEGRQAPSEPIPFPEPTKQVRNSTISKVAGQDQIRSGRKSAQKVS